MFPFGELSIEVEDCNEIGKEDDGAFEHLTDRYACLNKAEVT